MALCSFTTLAQTKYPRSYYKLNSSSVCRSFVSRHQYLTLPHANAFSVRALSGDEVYKHYKNELFQFYLFLKWPEWCWEGKDSTVWCWNIRSNNKAKTKKRFTVANLYVQGSILHPIIYICVFFRSTKASSPAYKSVTNQAPFPDPEPIINKKPEEMSSAERLIDWWLGETGGLYWLNKLSWGAIIFTVVAWILFRFIGPQIGLYQLEDNLLGP